MGTATLIRSNLLEIIKVRNRYLLPAWENRLLLQVRVILVATKVEATKMNNKNYEQKNK